MSLMLFRRKSQSEALIKAPSADLIKSDNEFTLPEPYVPKTLMDPEEFRAYKELAGNQFDNVDFIMEEVCQILVRMDIRLYPNEKVETLLNKQLRYYQKSVNKEASLVVWRPVTGKSKYESPIPVRIIKLMRKLQTESESRYFQGDCDPYGRFIISELAKGYRYRVFAENKSLICFLAIELFATNGYSNSNDSRHNLIIDAWRGPTFSDEEAKI